MSTVEGVPPPKWTPPAELDEYRIIRCLASGGFGTVYLAHDTLLDRPVAVKFLTVAGSPTVRARFLLEGRAIARLQHPNVVAVHRIGEVEGRLFLVSEFVSGQQLNHLPLPLPWERVLEIGIGLCQGLALAHRRGVLHRDIKPSNAMMTDQGEVKLLDFGLAKFLLPPGPSTGANGQDGGGARQAASGSVPIALGQCPTVPASAGPAQAMWEQTTTVLPERTGPRLPEAAAGGELQASAGETVLAPRPEQLTTPASHMKLTGAGAFAGTPLYVAPELWRGEPASRQSDVYSMGTLLYELCAGRSPFEGTERATLPRRVQQEDAPPLLSVAPTVEPRLALAIHLCLARDPAARYESADALLAALRALGGAEQSVAPEENPYRGLAAFEAEHRHLFFGCETEIQAILDKLRTETLVLVAGDSGVGKSSICRAGVLPRITAGALHGRYAVASLLPGRHPLAALEAALLPIIGAGERPLGERLRQGAAELWSQMQPRGGSVDGVLIFVDQLEELVTMAGEGEAAAVSEILGTLWVHGQGVRVLTAVRSDFLTRLAALPGLGEDISRGIHLVRPLGAAGMRQAIVGPAYARGYRFASDSVVDELSAAAARSPGGLPLLQFALQQIWELRDTRSKTIPATALSAIGGVEGALARHADRVLEELLPPQRLSARQVLTRLVSVEGTRLRRTAKELGADDVAVAAALEALVRGRLLVASEAAGSEGSAYEIAHEALIKSWPTLRSYLIDDAGMRAVCERLERAASEWQRLGKASEALWNERQLREATLLGDTQPSALERSFLVASRRRLRRQRWSRHALLLALLLALSLAYVGARVRARMEVSQQVAARLEQAGQLLRQARHSHRQVAALRESAFDRFDHGDSEAGEAVWARALDLQGGVESEYVQVTSVLENALALRADHGPVRRLLGEVLLERGLIAEGEHRSRERDELLARLAAYDDAGECRRRIAEPARLEVSSNPAGAEVVLERYQQQAGRLVAGRPRPIGRTPLGENLLPAGSYRLIFRLPEHADVRLPVALARGQRARVSVRLPVARDVPEGFVYVPAGQFLHGSTGDERLRQSFFGAPPLHSVATGEYLIARREVTFADWIRFLEHLPDAERRHRLPRGLGHGGEVELRQLAGGRWRLLMQPTVVRYTALDGEQVHYQGRSRRGSQDWLHFPVSGISWQDVLAYVGWLQRTGRVPGARPCTELEWERAARGADERTFPHGEKLAADDANFDQTYGRLPSAFGPDEVGSHPASRSPFELDDMAGNVWELVRGTRTPGEFVIKGGGWYIDGAVAVVYNRENVEVNTENPLIGARICATFGSPKGALHK